MRHLAYLLFGIGLLTPAAFGECFADNLTLVNFDSFASQMAGDPPGYNYYYPGYWDYDTSGPGDPEVQDANANGIYDRYDFALLAQAMCDFPAIDGHYQAALAFQEAIWVVGGVDYSYGAINGIAALDTMGADAADLIGWTSGSGYGPYTSSKAANEPLSAEGDLDGDGYTNLEEYQNVAGVGGGPADYARAASDPLIPSGGPQLIIPPGAPADSNATIAILVLGMAALGAVMNRRRLA